MGDHSSLVLLMVNLIGNTIEYLNALFVDLWSCEDFKLCYYLQEVNCWW